MCERHFVFTISTLFLFSWYFFCSFYFVLCFFFLLLQVSLQSVLWHAKLFWVQTSFEAVPPRAPQWQQIQVRLFCMYAHTIYLMVHSGFHGFMLHGARLRNGFWFKFTRFGLYFPGFNPSARSTYMTKATSRPCLRCTECSVGNKKYVDSFVVSFI